MEEILKVLLRVGTAVIADIFDTLGQVPPVLTTDLFSVPGPSVRFAGSAYTVTGESYRWSGGEDGAGAVTLWGRKGRGARPLRG